MTDDESLKQIRFDLVTDDDYMNAIRSNIQRFLSIYSLKELSEISDVPYETLKSLMYSNTNDCKVGMIIKLAKALNITVDELVGASTLEKETKESMCMLAMMPKHTTKFVRWAIRDGFSRLHDSVQDRSVNVMIAKCDDGMMTTQDFIRMDIDAPPDIIGKTIFGICMPCDYYVPNYYEGDIILIANDRLPNNKEHIVVHIGSHFWIMRKDLGDHKTLKDNRINNHGEYLGYICHVERH